MFFRGNFIIVLKRISSRSLKITVISEQKLYKGRTWIRNILKNPLIGLKRRLRALEPKRKVTGAQRGPKGSRKGAQRKGVPKEVSHYIILYDIIRYYMILHYMISYHIIWYYLILYDIVWYYMLLYDIIWYCMILYDIIWYDMILYHIIWYYRVLKAPPRVLQCP